MDLKGIISIAGMSGLYKILTTNKNGFIVESFGDKKRFAVSSAQRVSTLEDITIYTQDGDIPLKEVLKKLNEKAGKDINPDPKADPEQMKKDMAAVLPEYDKERVYNSDIKKLFTWYNILKESEFSFEDEPEPELVEEVTEPEKSTAAEGEEKKPKKARKKAGKTEEKPLKKTKKKSEKTAAAKSKSKTKPKTSAAKDTKGKSLKKTAAKKKK